jgi:hypothetical protein
MYCILRQRSQQALLDLQELLVTMALDPRIASTLAASDARTVRSSASTPSLRSRDGSVPMLARMDGGGNVRVVVRVRAFLKRGRLLELGTTKYRTHIDTFLQNSRNEQNV